MIKFRLLAARTDGRTDGQTYVRLRLRLRLRLLRLRLRLRLRTHKK